MAKAANTPIVLTAAILSQIISDTLKEAGASLERKSACLNHAAARICGPKHNWGYVVGQEGPVVAQPLRGSIHVSSCTGPAIDALQSPPTTVEDQLLTHPTPRSWHTVGEIVKHSATVGDQILTHPTLRSWHAVGEIVKHSEALLEAQRLAAKAPMPAPSGTQTHPSFDLDLLLGFMRTQPHFSHTICTYMDSARVQVRQSLSDGTTMPSMWQNLARLAKMVEKARQPGAMDPTQELCASLRLYITTCFPAHARALCATMEL